MDDGALALGYTAPTNACNDELGGCSFKSCHNKTSAHNTAKAGTDTQRAPNNDGLNNNNNDNNMAKANDTHPSTEKSGKDSP